MNLQELRKIINEYKDKIIINHPQPGQLINNKLLLKQYKNIFSYTSEMIYLVKNYDNLENLHISCYCGNKNNFRGLKYGYTKYCSNKCANINILHNYKIYQTKLNTIDENGMNTFQRIVYNMKNDIDESGLNKYQRIKMKQIKTMRNNIDENGLNGLQRAAIKRVQTAKNNIDKNGLNSYQRGAIKNINKQLNNVDENGLNGFQRARIKQRQTMLNDIDENGLNKYQRIYKKQQILMKNTIDKNGINLYQKMVNKRTQTMKNTIDEKGLNLYQKAIRKGLQTKLNNVDENGLNSIQRGTQKTKQKILNNINNGLNGYQQIAKKSYQTKKKNNSFKISKKEEECYQLLLQKFSNDDIETQYRSELYPFACDFYIKSLNLYIEYHGTWTHSPTKRNENRRPFKNSVEDMKIVEKLKKKNSKYYNLAIYVWTNLDVKKLNTFKKNKLNYKIFYTIEQFKNWFDKI